MPRVLRNFLIVLAVIVLVSLLLLSFFGRPGVTFVEDVLGRAVSGVGRFFSGIGNFLDEKIGPFFNVLNYKRLNENLVKENAALKEELINLTLTRKEISDLQDLERALKMTGSVDSSKKIGANVIGKDPGNWFNFFTIDVGRRDGVTKNSAVINSYGLVGLVYEVGETWSKVVSIIDQQSSVAFEMVRTKGDFDGVVSGSKDFKLICEFYDPEATFAIGDYIMTSGIGIYPKGIMIGKIVEEIEDSDFTKKVIVEPVVDFHKIKKVLVIKYQERE